MEEDLIDAASIFSLNYQDSIKKACRQIIKEGVMPAVQKVFVPQPWNYPVQFHLWLETLRFFIRHKLLELQYIKGKRSFNSNYNGQPYPTYLLSYWWCIRSYSTSPCLNWPLLFILRGTIVSCSSRYGQSRPQRKITHFDAQVKGSLRCGNWGSIKFE